MKILAKTLFLSLALGAMTTTAMAQDAGKQPEKKQHPGGPGEKGPRGQGPGGPGGPGGRGMGQEMSPEKAQAAWQTTAKGVAGRLKLSPEQTTALSRAYVEARTAMRTKMEDLRKNRADGGDVMEAQRTAQAEVKKDFDKALGDAKISDANVAKIDASLGSPMGLNGRQWDRAVDTIAGFKLDDAKKQTALNSVEDYMVSMGKTMETMRGGGDREAVQKAMGEAREKLNSELKGVLTEDQMKTFEEQGGMRGMRGGRPGGERPDGDRPKGKGDGNGGEKHDPKKDK